ncbi:hypothetical protein WMY93_012829 [Mugilogobius chulae]|uniref:C-type lectin domain-containing protein n=1 Tax=Mugilogobius chulae TaxID=88201 RepID=A0AAW0NYM1_9GOBI
MSWSSLDSVLSLSSISLEILSLSRDRDRETGTGTGARPGTGTEDRNRQTETETETGTGQGQRQRQRTGNRDRDQGQRPEDQRQRTRQEPETERPEGHTMDLKLLVLLLWTCSGLGHSSVLKRLYWYEFTPRTFQEADKFCRSEHNGSLATVVTDSDISVMDLKKFQAWIGLMKRGTGWSEPQDGNDCGGVEYQSIEAFGFDCDAKNFIFCEGGVHTQPIYQRDKTWSEGNRSVRARMEILGLLNTDQLGSWSSILSEERDHPVWIGLYHDGEAWKWSNGASSDYRNWTGGSEPPSGSDSCVVVSSQTKTMSVQSCSEAFPFLCYRDNLVLLEEKMSWEQALEACGNISPKHRLYSGTEYNATELESNAGRFQKTSTSKVWVGLRFLGGSWFWSDGGAVSLSLPECPQSGLHCGALVVDRSSGSDLIEPSDCSQSLSVLCYGEP